MSSPHCRAIPLPDAFVLETGSSAAELEKLEPQLKALPKVSYVQLDSAWVRRLESLLQIGRTAVLILATLLAAGLVAVTFNTIRLQILTQKDEIEVSKLIGATDAFIRRPFFYLGLVQGAMGGLAALAIVYAEYACAQSQHPGAGAAVRLELRARFLRAVRLPCPVGLCRRARLAGRIYVSEQALIWNRAKIKV